MNGSRTIVSSGQYTASSGLAGGPTIPDLKNAKAKGLKLTIDITSLNAGTPSITVTIKGKDPVSGKYFTILASASLATVATTILKVYPGLTAAANLTVSDVLDGDWTVIVVNADAQPINYSIGANLII